MPWTKFSAAGETSRQASATKREPIASDETNERKLAEATENTIIRSL
jgi:hypothetical protein